MNGKSHGFSPVELTITLAVVAIIISLAMPAYSLRVLKARRADARTSLMLAARAVENCYGRTFNYSMCVPDKQESKQGYYWISGAAESGYVLQATPKGDQVADAEFCAALYLDHLGRKTADGEAGKECWG